MQLRNYAELQQRQSRPRPTLFRECQVRGKMPRDTDTGGEQAGAMKSAVQAFGLVPVILRVQIYWLLAIMNTNSINVRGSEKHTVRCLSEGKRKVQRKPRDADIVLF